MEHRDEFLERVFQELLLISVGKCGLDDETVSSVQNESEFKVLSGLQLLHEELELYKNDLMLNIEKDFQLKVLKKKNEELASFNSAVSHDLKSPLRTINAFSGILLRKYGSQFDEDGRTFLRFIHDSSRRMTELVQGLLEYARADNLGPFKKLDLNAIVYNVLSDIQLDIDNALAEIVVHDLPSVNGCSVGIRQLFQNLIGNAVKFKKPGRSLRVDVIPVPHPDKVVIEIRDNGIGMRKEHLDTIFHIFSRLPTEEEYEGTGIGLSICKKIANLHSGDISVDSKFGEGTVFRISLPRYRLH